MRWGKTVVVLCGSEEVKNISITFRAYWQLLLLSSMIYYVMFVFGTWTVAVAVMNGGTGEYQFITIAVKHERLKWNLWLEKGNKLEILESKEILL